MYGSSGLDVDTVELCGGELCLDFVNTIEQRTSPEPDDLLRTPEDLERWGRRVGVLRGRTVTGVTAGELRAAATVRATLLTVIGSFVDGREPARTDLAELAAAGAAAYEQASIAVADGGLRWRWDPGVAASVRHRAVVSAIELLSSASNVRRTHRCANPDCGDYFFDRTKPGNRQWCSMRGCGNQAKSRRRREQRHRS